MEYYHFITIFKNAKLHLKKRLPYLHLLLYKIHINFIQRITIYYDELLFFKWSFNENGNKYYHAPFYHGVKNEICYYHNTIFGKGYEKNKKFIMNEKLFLIFFELCAVVFRKSFCYHGLP